MQVTLTPKQIMQVTKNSKPLDIIGAYIYKNWLHVMFNDHQERHFNLVDFPYPVENLWFDNFELMSGNTNLKPRILELVEKQNQFEEENMDAYKQGNYRLLKDVLCEE